MQHKSFLHKKYSVPTLPVSQEDVLYLQSQLVVNLYKDYWQAQSIFSKILKLSPYQRLGQKCLKNIRFHIGY